MKLKKLSKVKPGDFIKKKEHGSTVLIKGHYDRATKTFGCQYAEDMNRETFLRSDKMVWTGFAY